MPLLKLISMNKINDEKIKRVKQRKILKLFIILFVLANLALAIHTLVTGFTPILAIISFLIEALLSRYRNKLDPKLVTSDLKNLE